MVEFQFGWAELPKENGYDYHVGELAL